jgi:hypothetical protein
MLVARQSSMIPTSRLLAIACLGFCIDRRRSDAPPDFLSERLRLHGNLADTPQDIAVATGFSVNTVSPALRASRRIPAETAGVILRSSGGPIRSKRRHGRAP